MCGSSPGCAAGKTSTPETELAHAHRIDIAAPTLGEIAQAATTAAGDPVSEDILARMVGDATSGGWLIARLVREIADSITELTEFQDLAALVAARAGLAAR